MKKKIRWKGNSAAELPEYHCKGYVYYLGDSGDYKKDGDCWCITRTPEKGIERKRFCTYRELRAFIFPGVTDLPSNTEEDFKLDIYLNCHSVRGTSLLAQRILDKQGKIHKIAIDLDSKEIWEYLDREVVLYHN